MGLSIVFNKFDYALCFYHISHTIMIHTNKYNCNSLVFCVLFILYKNDDKYVYSTVHTKAELQLSRFDGKLPGKYSRTYDLSRPCSILYFDPCVHVQ